MVSICTQAALLSNVLCCLAAVPWRQQNLQSLSHWNWDLPPQAHGPYQNSLYDPLKTTADAARTWNPIYPQSSTLSGVDVTLTSACDWPEVFEEGTGLSEGFSQTSECTLDNKTDVSVKLTMNYSVYQGVLREGFKAIADSPQPSSPVPWILQIQDGNGVSLNYTLYRDDAAKQWWVHYMFANPVSNSMYTVQLEYQLRKVLSGTSQGSNSFQADWLQQWDSPVQSMDVNWVFPYGYKPTKFSVTPSNQEEDGEPSQITAVCCGNNDTTNVAKCTDDLDEGLVWASNPSEVNNCLNQSVVLRTSLRVASGVWADVDAGVNLKDVYAISFSPGFVTQSNANVKGGQDLSWILPLLLILVFPCLAAIFWMSQTDPRSAQFRKD